MKKIEVVYSVIVPYDIDEILYFVNKGKEDVEKYNSTPVEERWDMSNRELTLVEAVADRIYDSMDELHYHIPIGEYSRVARNFIELAEAINGKE